MTNTPKETTDMQELREEFNKWYEGKKVYEDLGISSDQTHLLSITEWFFKKIQARDQILLGKIEKKRREVYEHDRESFGYDLLEGGVCCPGDDAASGYVKGLDVAKTLIEER